MRDIICIGASAGGVEALTALAGSLADDFCGTLFIVLHIPAHARSFLPEIISRAGPLPALTAIDGHQFQPGTIYVAPPDHHLLVTTTMMNVVRGPLENRSRPAIDPLFQSVARFHGERAIGVILSGMLQDGRAGLKILKDAGGVTVTQTLSDCQHPDMPRNAGASTHIDFNSNASDMGPLFKRIQSEDAALHQAGSLMPGSLRSENGTRVGLA